MLTRSRYLLTAIVLAGLLSPADAFAFDFHLFGKKNKTDPAERVPALILQLKTDPDEGKRQAAILEIADELVGNELLHGVPRGGSSPAAAAPPDASSGASERFAGPV